MKGGESSSLNSLGLILNRKCRYWLETWGGGIPGIINTDCHVHHGKVRVSGARSGAWTLETRSASMRETQRIRREDARGSRRSALDERILFASSSEAHAP